MPTRACANSFRYYMRGISFYPVYFENKAARTHCAIRKQVKLRHLKNKKCCMGRTYVTTHSRNKIITVRKTQVKV